MNLVISLLALLKQNCVDVTFQVIDGDERFLEREGERLGIADANQQSSGEAGALRNCDGIDRFVSVFRLGQCLTECGPDTMCRLMSHWTRVCRLMRLSRKPTKLVSSVQTIVVRWCV